MSFDLTDDDRLEIERLQVELENPDALKRFAVELVLKRKLVAYLKHHADRFPPRLRAIAASLRRKDLERLAADSRAELEG